MKETVLEITLLHVLFTMSAKPSLLRANVDIFWMKSVCDPLTRGPTEYMLPEVGTADKLDAKIHVRFGDGRKLLMFAVIDALPKRTGKAGVAVMVFTIGNGSVHKTNGDDVVVPPQAFVSVSVNCVPL